MVYAPGTILQHIYLKERLRTRRPGRFLDVGCGDGHISRILLERGWHGIGIDLHQPNIDQAAQTNSPYVQNGAYELRGGDFLESTFTPAGFDLIISSLVIEHLDDSGEEAYFCRCRQLLADDGLAIVLVPSSPAHWGIEDITCGHLRRYTQNSLVQRLNQMGWDMAHISGLTFPISNLLLGLSNYLVRRHESYKLSLPASEQTKLSGCRNIRWKETFPWALGLVINEWTMLPFHTLQRCFSAHPSSMILYAECTPGRSQSSSKAA